jgi:quercetin dioxygenase-like cupin family protein
MSDPYGLKRAEELGITLGNVGQKLLMENEHIRVWEVALAPGETIDFHIHHHPYLVVSLGGGDNEVETIFGDKRPTHEPLGHLVFMDTMRPVHKLTNKSTTPYLSRLIELKHLTLEADEPAKKRGEPKMPSGSAEMSPDTASALTEFLVHTDDLQWAEKSLAGLSQKTLWRNEETGASIALIKFEKGSGIPQPHLHASNQFMYCISGKYRYVPTNLTLLPGAFYCNPKGCVHGPTIADETSIFLEIYDGPHYPVRPSWYNNDEDAL